MTDGKLPMTVDEARHLMTLPRRVRYRYQNYDRMLLTIVAMVDTPVDRAHAVAVEQHRLDLVEIEALRAALKDRIDLVERLITTLGQSVQDDIRRDNTELRKRFELETKDD